MGCARGGTGVVALALLLASPLARAGDPIEVKKVAPVLQARIDDAITRGIAWLPSRQGKDGTWA